VLLLLVNLFMFRRLQLLNARLSGEGDKQSGALRSLSAEISALCSGASGMGDHLIRVEQQVRRLHERQDQLEMRDPVNREYHQAVKLIRSGVGLEELIASCGLVRAEAELLMRLHGPGREQEEDAAASLQRETVELNPP
ncbi:MAG: DUF2802 domain-containing protein, partial [Gammaproteobacteria bacterium]